MSRSSTRDRCRPAARDRGQTEPVAALVAVAALALAIGVYAGYATDIHSNERDVADATLESAWADLATGGAYDPDRADPVADLERLPDGYHVVVTVTAGGEVVDEVHRRPDGSVGSGDGPDRAAVAGRPIAVVRGAGDVRGGRLRVAVWR